jgi:hypothetical protein
MTQDKRKKAVNLPGEESFKNTQLDLFQTFLCNTEEERDRLSNTIDLWDSIPRYAISRQEMNKRRTKEGFLDLLNVEFQYRGQALTALIQPARIREADGATLDYYPSATEELVEDALRKIATEYYRGFFDKPSFRSGVVFSLYALRQELQRRGHTRSYQEIVKSLTVLSGSVIELRAQNGSEGEGFARSAYFPALGAVSRKRLADDPNARWMVQFHPLVTESIDALAYRQFNYDQMMKLSTQLARWLHKQLSLKYTFASQIQSFETRYSTVKRDSQLLRYRRERDNVAALDEALEELAQDKIIAGCRREEITGARGKIEDVKYTITPSKQFITEMKAANKRKSVAVDNSTPPPVTR